MLVGIVGAGVMGQGIAQTFAMAAGYKVILSDVSLEFAQRGKDKIVSGLHSMVKKGKLTEADSEAIAADIQIGEIKDLAECNLIIEAIKEELTVKRDLFASLEAICRPEAIFASNTSALSLSEMAAGRQHPIVGMHFFNPVPRMKLVEVVGALQTPPELLEQVYAIAEEIGKTPVMVKESSGFVVNRILVPMINEAIGVYADRVASAADIDTAMKLGANHPIGPLALADLIGLDVCLAIMEVLAAGLKSDKYQPHPLLQEMAAKGTLGRKTGSGFYNYE